MRSNGFTLMELVVAVAVASGLAAVAVPSYQSYVAKSQIAEAEKLINAERVQLISNMQRGFCVAPSAQNTQKGRFGVLTTTGTFVASKGLSCDSGCDITYTVNNDASKLIAGKKVSVDVRLNGDVSMNVGSTTVDPKYLTDGLNRAGTVAAGDNCTALSNAKPVKTPGSGAAGGETGLAAPAGVKNDGTLDIDNSEVDKSVPYLPPKSDEIIIGSTSHPVTSSCLMNVYAGIDTKKTKLNVTFDIPQEKVFILQDGRFFVKNLDLAVKNLGPYKHILSSGGVKGAQGYLNGHAIWKGKGTSTAVYDYSRFLVNGWNNVHMEWGSLHLQGPLLKLVGYTNCADLKAGIDPTKFTGNVTFNKTTNVTRIVQDGQFWIDNLDIALEQLGIYEHILSSGGVKGAQGYLNGHTIWKGKGTSTAVHDYSAYLREGWNTVHMEWGELQIRGPFSQTVKMAPGY